MVLVAGEHARRTLGTRLLKRCIDALRETGTACPCSMPRPAGRPLYRALGFEETWGYHRLARGNATPLPEHSGTLAARPFARSPTRTGPHCAPMMPHASAPTAARCCNGCAGGCRQPN
jgi:GNAT superfamily N-acetyltransferase